MAAGLISPTNKGTSQSGNLSPLLNNIYLTEFDRMLESREYKFVRYADSCNIYAQRRRTAGRAVRISIKYLEGELKLKINRKGKPAGAAE